MGFPEHSPFHHNYSPPTPDPGKDQLEQKRTDSIAIPRRIFDNWIETLNGFAADPDLFEVYDLEDLIVEMQSHLPG